MKRVIEVCDHCAEPHDLLLCEYDGIGLELCSDCMPKLREHFAAFNKVSSISATVNMHDRGMKSL